MTIRPELRQALIRAHLLNSQAEAFVQWHKAALAPLMDEWRPGEMDRELSALKPDERKQLEKLMDTLPGSDEFLAMEELIRGLTNGNLANMNSEDRRYMAEVRCWLEDALDHARRGDFQDAYIEATEAFDRIEWVLNGRKRKGDRNYRRLVNIDVRTDLADARDGVGEIVREFHHAHVALSR